MTSALSALGWNESLNAAWEELGISFCVPGRVIADYGQAYKVATPQEVTAEVSGRLQYVLATHQMPKIGDWVALQLLDDGHGMIHQVLPRKSEISRRRAGEQYEQQVLAANVDLAFLVQALDNDFSPERLRRYIFQLQKDSVQPIIVLNKADKVTDSDSRLAELATFGCEVLITSATEETGVAAIAAHIQPAQTAVFMGSSGVGKSTLTNVLLGEQRQVTQAIREADSKGRHTTTHRELFVLPGGGLLIDTPGLRELQLWGTEQNLGTAFPEIEAFVRQCKYSNCTHTTEQGCAVLDAQQRGLINDAELTDYFKFQKEIRYLNTKVDVRAANNRQQAHKRAQRAYNQQLRSKKKL